MRQTEVASHASRIVMLCAIGTLLISSFGPGAREAPRPPSLTVTDHIESGWVRPTTAFWNAVVNWTSLGSPSGPGPRADEVFVSTGASTGLLFGGQGAGGPSDLLGDSWAADLSNASFQLVTSARTPSPREYAAAAYDPGANRVVLFGGANSTSVLGDTWFYSPNNQSWWASNRPAPSPRFDASMAWDSTSGQVVLFGGFGKLGPSSAPLSDWWSLSPQTGVWTNLTQPGGPSGRGGASLLTSGGVAGVLLFGGGASPVGDSPLNDTWQFNTSAAVPSRPPAAQAPPPRVDAEGCAALNGTIPYLFGGTASTGGGGSAEFNDSWVWAGDHSGWLVPQTVQNRPAGLDGAGALWSSGIFRCYVYGGFTATGAVSSTLYAVSMGGSQPLTSSIQGPSQVALGGTANLTALAAGGLPPYSFSWSVNGSTMSLGNQPSLPFRPLRDALYSVTVMISDSAGQTTSASQGITVTGPGPISVRVTLAASSPSGADTFLATVLGGTPPYLFRWSGPGANGSWSTDPQWVSAPLGNGTFLISVSVTDRPGYLGTGSLTVRNSVQTSSANLDLLLGGIGILGGAVGLVGGLWVLRRRRRQRPPSKESTGIG